MKTDKAGKIDLLNHQSWKEMIADPRAGLEFAEKALQLGTQNKYDIGCADAHLNIGWCRIYLGQADSSLTALNSALELYTKLDQLEGCMKVYNAIGVVYQYLSKYESALEYYSKSLALSKTAGNMERQIAALNNIGEFYLELKNPEEALGFFTEAMQLAEEIGDSERKANVSVNIGLTYRNLNEIDDALKYINRATDICIASKDKITLARCYTVSGLLYEESGESVQAEENHKKSIDICEGIGNKHGEMEACFNLANLYKSEKKNDEALLFFSKALNLSIGIGTKSTSFACYKEISLIYENKQDYRTALEYFRKFYVTEKNVFSEEAKQHLEKLITSHEIEKAQQEKELFRLKHIELKQKNEQLEQAHDRMQIVGEIGREITAFLDIEKIMFAVYEHVNRLMDASTFGIAFYHEEQKEIEYKLFIEETRRLPSFVKKLNPEDNFGSWCIIHDKEIMLGDARKEHTRYIKHRTKTVGKTSNSIIYLPLKIKQSIIGLLTVQSYQKNAYTLEHLDILKALASYIAIALENSIIHDQVYQLNTMLNKEKQELQEANKQIAYLANHDILTGIPNRRLLYELVQHDIRHAKREKTKLAFFYIDLDNFKEVNDNYGHAVGDELLKVVAERLKNSLRESDTIARLGGDEFIAVIRGCKSKKDLKNLARKVLDHLVPRITIFGKTCTIRASLGISIYPDNGETFTELLKKADNAMYTVKEFHGQGFQFSEKRKEP